MGAIWRAARRSRVLSESDGRIWQITYGQIGRQESSAHTAPDELAKTSEELSRILLLIKVFAEQHNCGNLVGFFDRGIIALSAANPLSSTDHPDIAPLGFMSPAAQALLAVAQSAWVFWGMGSWNDLAFSGNDLETYELLSNQLYGLLNAAIVQATNTSFRP